MDAIAKQSKDIQLQLLAMDSENKKLSSKLQPSDLRIRQTQVWIKNKIYYEYFSIYNNYNIYYLLIITFVASNINEIIYGHYE